MEKSSENVILIKKRRPKHLSVQDRSDILLSQRAAFYRMSAMTSDLEKTMRWAHRANVRRYRRILKTPLTETERRFVQRRIAEEEKAMEPLGSEVSIEVAADVECL